MQPIQRSGLFRSFHDALPTDTAVTVDAGTLCLQATDALCFDRPGNLFTPLDSGLAGVSFAAGLSWNPAQRDGPVVGLMGNGGFGMTVSELSTAVDCGINALVIVMNNGCWGAEEACQRGVFGSR